MTHPDEWANERDCVAAIYQGGALALYRARSARLAAVDFQDTEFARFFAACCAVIDAGGVLDEASLDKSYGKAAYEGRGLSGAHIARILAGADVGVSAENAAYFAEQVSSTGRTRRTLEEFANLATIGRTWNGTGQELIEEAQRRFTALGAYGSAQKSVRMSEIMPAFWEQFQADYNRPAGLSGVSTGYTRLDYLTQGFQGGDTIIIKALTGVGKSILTMNMAVKAAKADGAHVHIYSLEMKNRRILSRMMWGEAMIPASAYRNRKIELIPDGWKRLHDAHQRLMALPISVYDDASITISEISNNSQAAKMAGELDMVVVDYAQLITPVNSRREGTREREIAEISRSLKILADSLDIPVLIVSQINDSGQERESKTLAHDASIRLHLESLDPPGTTRTPEEAATARPHKLTIEKNRDNASGIVLDLVFQPEYTLFAEATTDYNRGIPNGF